MEAEDELSFEDSQEDEFEIEDVVQGADSDDEGDGDGEWEDCDSDDSEKARKSKKVKAMVEAAAAQEEQSKAAKPKAAQPKQESAIWDEKKRPLQEGEELEYDGSAYVMLHRSKVEWPCLSIDYLVRDRCTLDGFEPASTWFPMQANGQLDPNSGTTVPDTSRTNGLRHKKD